jgi:hypothetical protein
MPLAPQLVSYEIDMYYSTYNDTLAIPLALACTCRRYWMGFIPIIIRESKAMR